jgi:hypothetical protein
VQRALRWLAVLAMIGWAVGWLAFAFARGGG